MLFGIDDGYFATDSFLVMFLGCCLSFHPRLRLGLKLNNNLGPKEIIYRPRVVLYRNPRHHDLFWIIKSSTVFIFKRAGIKCDHTTRPSLATQPNTITEAVFFNCVIECIAGGDSCVLTVGDLIRNQPVANMMSGGRTSLRLSLATTVPTHRLHDGLLPTV